MSDEPDFQPFIVPAMGLGLRRHMRPSLGDAGEMFICRGWVTRAGSVVRAPGARVLGGGHLLGAHTADELILGGLYLVDNVFSNDWAVFAYNRPEEIPDTIRLIDDYDSDYDLWQMFVDGDDPSLVVDIELHTPNPPGGTFRSPSGQPYGGTRWGDALSPPTWTSASRRSRLRLRRKEDDGGGTGATQGRYGPWDATDGFEPIPVCAFFKLTNDSGVEQYVACTPHEIFMYDSAGNDFPDANNINPVIDFNADIALIAPNLVNGATFGGVFTGFVTDGAKVGDVVKFDSDDQVAWTRISIVNGETSVTLAEHSLGTVPLTNEDGAVRSLYGIGEGPKAAKQRPWRGLEWIWGSPGRRLILTNGWDRPQVWDGTGVSSKLAPLSGLDSIPESPVRDVQRAYGVFDLGERVVFYNVWEDTGSGLVHHPMRYIWSEARDCEDWPEDKRAEVLIDDELIADHELDDVRVVMGRRSITNFRVAESPFDIAHQETSAVAGCVASRTLSRLPDGRQLIFLGPGNVYLYDGYAPREIGNDVRREIFDNIVDDRMDQACAFSDPTTGLWIVAFPSSEGDGKYNDRTLAFDWREETWSDLEHKIHGFGKVELSQSLPYSDFLDEPYSAYMSRPYSYYLNQRQGEVLLLGGPSGQVLASDGLSSTFDRADIMSDGAWKLTDCEYRGIKYISRVELDASALGGEVLVAAMVSMNGIDWELTDEKTVMLDESPQNVRTLTVDVDRDCVWVGLRVKSEGFNAHELATYTVWWQPQGQG